MNQRAENAADLKDAKSQWAAAANRRLENIKSGSYNPIPAIQETAADVNLRRVEGNQSSDPYGAMTGQGAATKARLLDWEHAKKQAETPGAPTPDLNQYAE